MRVVIADDHEAVRSGVAAILATDPAIEIVGEAENGFDALALCVRETPDVILLDLRMPGTDGIWATERITAETDTRVLVLTTYDSDDLIAQALAAGASGYLLKSTRGPDLVRAVHHVAERRHVIDPAVTGGIIARLNASSGVEAPVASPALDRCRLTGREAQVLDLLAAGLSNQAIADHLHIGLTTVKTHVGALYAKTGTGSRVELARLGSERGGRRDA
ncbi:response regulator transcription factor [Leucobacter tardus]|uniref:Response regulator transcription factor n=1 Tax=Leucobacter tardus TaxID=501483 RepID=A0A939QG80_9MICO|nr:response regulator transcription factor [Leucobacter tardus]